MSDRFTRLLITGGSGFIGSHLVEAALARFPGVRVTNLDALTYAADPEFSPAAGGERYQFVHGDVCDAALVGSLVGEADAVCHLAAESHVDRSIDDAAPFVRTNVVGTQTVLDAVRRASARSPIRLLVCSTDEVYGDLPLDAPRRFTERDPMVPSSPYAATKAAGDALAVAYARTFGVDVSVTRCGNNMGPRQSPDKLVPRFITMLMEGERVPVFGDGLHVRDWLHVADHAGAMLDVLERGRAGAVYNVGAGCERSNLDLTHEVLSALGLGDDRIEHVADRPGHDRRYAIDASVLRAELGWSPRHADVGEMLAETVAWYRANEAWWRAARGRVAR
ncbi:MAG: dTDP-glucose 4,6-dehydratase [Planctomycetota bacterium]